MTSAYVTEPPTSGLVQLVTSKGTLDIELWPRECPLATRNFLTLALEGFYDNLIFHRLIRSFIIQSGDPTGTGSHGESSFGSPFPIEPHSRLKFNRRGLLAMAASQDKTNESQFFLTLDATPELQGKHTLFGRVVGKSIYNLVELGEVGEMVEERGGERPRYPPKLVEVRVVENPFDDLKPRMTREQRREMKSKEKQERKRRRQEEGKRKKKKTTTLLSFGQEEEAAEETVLKGPKSTHDLLKADKRLSKQAMGTGSETMKVGHNISRSQAGPSTAPPLKQAQPELAIIEETKSRNGKHTEPANPHPHPRVKATTASSLSGRDLLTAHRAKYTSPSSSSSKPSKPDSLSALLSFQSRLRSNASSQPKLEAARKAEDDDDDDEEEAKEYGSSDDDVDWREHRLEAGGQPLDPNADDDYEVLDPRQDPTNANASSKPNRRQDTHPRHPSHHHNHTHRQNSGQRHAAHRR